MWLAVPAVGSRASSSSSTTPLEPPEDTYIPPHPRPLLRRPVWASLDGLWDHVVLPANASSVAGAQVVLTSDGAPIRVPFPIESNLSQVRRSLGSDERLWYRRKFHFADGCGAADSKIIRFGAVDWEAHVWFNGQPAGTHRGGYEPFELDVGPLVYGTAWGDGWRGPHELLVASYAAWLGSWSLEWVADSQKLAFQKAGKRSEAASKAEAEKQAMIRYKAKMAAAK